MLKNLPAMWGPGFDPWVKKIWWRREGQPTPVFLPGELHGQRSLAGYSLWDCRVRYRWVTNTFIFICKAKKKFSFFCIKFEAEHLHRVLGHLYFFFSFYELPFKALDQFFLKRCLFFPSVWGADGQFEGINPIINTRILIILLLILGSGHFSGY